MPSSCWVCASGAATKQAGDSCRFQGDIQPVGRPGRIELIISIAFRILSSWDAETCTFHPGDEVSDPVYPMDFVNARNRPDEMQTVMRMRVSSLSCHKDHQIIRSTGAAGTHCQATDSQRDAAHGVVAGRRAVPRDGRARDLR